MKKNIVLLSAILSLPILAFSQDEWNTTPNSTVPMYRDGFVGIGTGALPALPFVVTDPNPGNGAKVAFGNNGLLGSFPGGTSVLEISSQLNTDGAWLGLFSGTGINRSGFQIGVSPFGAGFYSGRGSSGTTRPILFYTQGTAGMTEKMRIDIDGKIGMGTAGIANAQLVVTDPTSGNGTKIAFGNNGMLGSWAAASQVLELTGINNTEGSWLGMYSSNAATRSQLQLGVSSTYGINFFSGSGTSGVIQPITFFMGMSEVLRLRTDGKVGIGAPLSYPGTYKLYVTGGILTEKVKVALDGTANWADYVFAPDYKLRPLSDVAAYINENKHLPGIPSAEQVVKDGIDVATMDAKLLEKIEELTLYIIDLKKEVEQLKKESNSSSKK